MTLYYFNLPYFCLSLSCFDVPLSSHENACTSFIVYSLFCAYISHFRSYIPLSTDISFINRDMNFLNFNFLFIDTPSNSKMLSMLLRGRGIICDTASNGLEAVDLVKEQGESYDLIFMDFTMPVMVSIYVQC